MDEPTSPVEAYRAIIDKLIAETRLYGSSRHVAESGFYSKAPSDHEFNDFVRTMTGPQREVLARMLLNERDRAIADTLAALTWWICCRGVALTFRGEPMPEDISGMGMHCDYAARRDGWEWPAGGGETGG